MSLLIPRDQKTTFEASVPLNEKIEAIRRRLESRAMDIGLDHPEVYQLSCELDQLHNLWERERVQERRNICYNTNISGAF